MVEWRQNCAHFNSDKSESKPDNCSKRSWSTTNRGDDPAAGERRRRKRVRFFDDSWTDSKSNPSGREHLKRSTSSDSMTNNSLIEERRPKRACFSPDNCRDNSTYCKSDNCFDWDCSGYTTAYDIRSNSSNSNSGIDFERHEQLRNIESWTSGDKNIDEIIQRSQTEPEDFEFGWIEFNEFNNIKPLSSGGNASIYTATWRNSDPAVLKVMHAGSEVMKLLVNELANLESVTKQENRHRSIPTLHGITKHAESGDFALVMSYYQDGNVRSYIERNSGSLPWRKRLELLRAVIRSLKAAHEHEIVHCNLHTGNLLFDSISDNDDFLTVISDFGLSKALKSTVAEESGTYGVLPYMAPEVITGQPCTVATDTYALGMIMWEISAGEPPFNHCSHDIYLKLSICDGARPRTLKGTPDCWVKLMEKCWQNDPKNRPTLTDMEDEMHSWDDTYEQFEEAERYRQDNPGPPRKPKHPDAHYSSRFIHSIVPPETSQELFDDEEWDQILENMN